MNVIAEKKLKSLRQDVQEYDTLKNKLTNSPNHHHHPQLNKLSATIKDGISLVENRYDELHKDLHNTDSQTPNPIEKAKPHRTLTIKLLLLPIIYSSRPR